jgi:hypothetical protein
MHKSLAVAVWAAVVSVFLVLASAVQASTSGVRAVDSGLSGAAPATTPIGPLVTVDAPSPESGLVQGMVTDRFGTVTVVWSRAGAGMFAAQRSVGGVWSTPQRIGCVGEVTCDGARVAVNSKGRVTVVWNRYSSYLDVMLVTKPRGGAWSDPVQLTQGPGRRQGTETQLDVAPDGAAVVSWIRMSSRDSVALYKPAQRAWSAAVPVELPGMRATDVAVSRSGVGMVVGQNSPEAPRRAVYARVYDPGVGWLPVTTLGSGGGEYPTPRVAFGPRGWAAAAWAASTSDGLRTAVVVRRMDTTHQWWRPRQLSARLSSDYPPLVDDVVVKQPGRVTVRWSGVFDWVSTRRVDSTWDARRLAEIPHGVPLGELAGNDEGVGVMPWYRRNSTDAAPYEDAVFASIRRPGRLAWSPTVQLGTAFGGTGERGDLGWRPFSAIVLPDGKVVVAWFDPAQALVARTVG